LTFPSGSLLGKIDFDLFVGLCLCFNLGGFLVLVGRGEDAKRDRYSGFKIQIGDLDGARVLSSTTFRCERKEDKKIPLAFFLD
jgi:hypothetical protein